MFRCDHCKQLTKPKEKMVKIVLERRNKDYFAKDGSYQGSGTEIVREARIGAECAALMTEESLKVR